MLPLLYKSLIIIKSNLFLPRIRLYKSMNRGNDLERFAEYRVPSGKDLAKIYTASASKRVYFRFGKDSNTGKNLNFAACTRQLRTCQMDLGKPYLVIKIFIRTNC